MTTKEERAAKREERAKKSQRTYQVKDKMGEVHVVTSDFMFNNSGELVFRSGKRAGNTEIVATFAAGTWSSCVKVITEEKESTP